MKKGFFKSRTFKIIVALAVIFAGFIIGSAVNGRSLSLPSSFVEVFTTPFQQLANLFKGGFSGIGKYFENQKQLRDENGLLQSQVAELTSRLSDYEQTKLDNELYKQILGITEKRPDFKMVGASVITAGDGENYYTFTVSKGSSSGIKKGDAAVTAEGIVGVVSEVGLNYSKVTTLLSPSTNIGGYDTGSHSFGVLTTTVQLSDQGLVKLTYLPQDSVLTVGNVVITSGQGSNYPQGLVVGVIQRVTADDQGVSHDAVILPSADIKKLDTVLIITAFDPEAYSTVYETSSATSAETSSGTSAETSSAAASGASRTSSAAASGASRASSAAASGASRASSAAASGASRASAASSAASR